jgi:adenine-specific DNA-methyltransferase
MDKYYTQQIITYMGNKRKVIPHIEQIINIIKANLGKDKLTIGDGFSGSGVVSRLFKNRATELYVNDIAGYSKTINECYLATPNNTTLVAIKKYIDAANLFVNNNNNNNNNIDKFIQLHWSPSENEIKLGDRAYYTIENARRIDSYRYYINTIPSDYRHYLLAPLLVEASKHNNCSGHFAAFYKKDNIGHFGGKNNIDVKRITQNIELPMPIFSDNKCKLFVSQKDTNEWIKELPELDLVYYDPPYNKHPYHIYYFLLDLINNWDIDVEIPDTCRGQPKTWTVSAYNSTSKAAKIFEDLIKNTRAKYILVSYNNEGIIGEKEMKVILSKYGIVTENYIEHNTYNRMKGIAEWKKGQNKSTEKIKECLYLLDTRPT